jgi:hypothetical protein
MEKRERINATELVSPFDTNWNGAEKRIFYISPDSR